MAFDDDSVRLLFELVADSTGVGPAVEHANAKVQELKTTFVAELGAVSTAGRTAFDDLTNHLSDFVSARLPLVGEGFEKTAEGFKEFAESSEAVEKHVEKLGEVIETIAEKTGKTEQEVGAFLKTLAGVKDDGDRSAAALGFFGDAAGSVKKELGEAGQEMAALTKATEEANSGLGSLLSPMGLLIGAAVALTGAVAGTIFELFELAEKSTAYGEEIFKAHLKTRLSIDTVGALKIAAHEAGESLESLNIGLLRFGHNLDSAAKGNETLARQLRGQGVESFDSVDKALEEYIAHLGSLRTEEEQSASISQIFGARFGARLIEVFHQVGGNLEAFKTELEETGHLMSEDSVRAAHEATVAHHQLEEEYAALTRRIGAALIPALLGVTTALKSYPFVFAAAALAVSALATGIAALQFPRLISFIVGVGDNVVLLTRQMFGLAVAEDAVAVSTQALTLAWGGVAIIAITGLVIALSQYENATERANKLTEKQIEEQAKALEGSLKLSEAVKEVSDGQGESADRHEQLNAILNQLDPTTRTYISTLQTEEERIAALNETIKQHVEQNRDELISSLVTVGDGILDQVRAVDKNKAAIASLTEQVKGYQETLRRNPNNPQIQRDFNEAVLLGSKRIAELSEEQKRLNDELTKNEAKLALTGKALNLTADGLRDVFKAAGDTQDRVKLLGDIFQSFTPEVSKATEQLKEQADAWEKLRGSLAGTLDRAQLLNQEQQAGVIISEDERKAIEEKTLERQHDLDVATKAAEEENARNADLLKRGKITRAEESRDVIENLKKVAEAQKAAGEEALEQRVKELEKLRQQKADDPEKSLPPTRRSLTRSSTSWTCRRSSPTTYARGRRPTFYRASGTSSTRRRRSSRTCSRTAPSRSRSSRTALGWERRRAPTARRSGRPSRTPASRRAAGFSTTSWCWPAWSPRPSRR
jgi:hypothetical protein